MIIYCLTNLVNRKRYIGLTKLELSRRVAQHATALSVVGKAIRKYGIQSFQIQIIDIASNYEVLQEKERFWIAHFRSAAPRGYNLTSGGDGNHDMPAHVRRRMGAVKGSKQSEETKQKRSRSLRRFYADAERSKEAREKIAAGGRATRGRKLTKAQCRHISEIQRGQKRSPLSLEVKQKISRASIRNNTGKYLIESGKPTRWQKGQRAWNKNKSMSDEWRKHLSEAHKGHKPSEETRHKMSKAMKGHPNYNPDQPRDLRTGRMIPRMVQ